MQNPANNVTDAVCTQQFAVLNLWKQYSPGSILNGQLNTVPNIPRGILQPLIDSRDNFPVDIEGEFIPFGNFFIRAVSMERILNVPIYQFRLFVASSCRVLFRRIFATPVDDLPHLVYDHPPLAKSFRIGLWRADAANREIITRSVGIRQDGQQTGENRFITSVQYNSFSIEYYRAIYDMITDLYERVLGGEEGSGGFFEGLAMGQTIYISLKVKYAGAETNDFNFPLPFYHQNPNNNNLFPVAEQEPPADNNVEFLQIDDAGADELEFIQPPQQPPQQPRRRRQQQPPRRSARLASQNVLPRNQRNRRPPDRYRAGGRPRDYIGGRGKGLYSSVATGDANGGMSSLSAEFGVYINPDHESERCLPMAMMFAERITYHYDLDTYECAPANSTAAKYATFDNCAIGRALFPQETFYPMSIVRWIDLSLEVHLTVIERLQRLIHYNSMNTSVSAYAEAFQINIHVFRTSCNYRVGVFRPKNRVQAHCIFVLHGNHLHPVEDIRKFVGCTTIFCMHCFAQVPNTKWNSHIKTCHSPQNSFGVSKYMHAFQRKVKIHDKFPKLVGFQQKRKCQLCGLVTQDECHTCYIPPSKIPSPIANNKLWVLDIEASQEICSASDGEKYAHTPVLICLMNMYEEGTTTRLEFYSELEFLQHLQLEPKTFDGCTFVAHNGGGYDYQHFVRGCDMLGIEYAFIPTPASNHKYLELSIFVEQYKFRFIDFMRFVSGSLATIAKSFGLADQKTYFPHRFLSEQTLHYVGPLPPNEPDGSDYWCVRNMRNEEEIVEFTNWYNSYEAPVWDLYQFMKEYCWMDVKVLAAACREFREGLMHPDTEPEFGWQPQPIDPFCFMTQSQMSMCLFLNGFGKNHPKIYLTVGRYRASFSYKQISWMELMGEKAGNVRIQHLGNSECEYVLPYTDITCDGFCHATNTVYDFITCSWEGCIKCKSQNLMNPRRQIHYSTCWEERQKRIHDITKLGYQLVEIHECDYDAQMVNLSLEIKAELQFEGEVYNDREIFYGGRTEVFSPFVHSDRLREKLEANWEIKYHDVCSLYPTVCSHDRLPTGKPIFLFRDDIDWDRVGHNVDNPYFGFIKCKVVPNPNDPIGLLPRRLAEERMDNVNGCDQGGKLVFDLHEKVGFWATCEIYLAMKHGYEVTDIYQVIHFEETECQPIMKGYMSYFLRSKQENEGWKKLGLVGEETDEKKAELVEQLFVQNGNMGRIRPDRVTKNPVVRHVSKLFLNCLWGKFGQRRICDAFMDIHNYEDLEGLLYHSGLDENKILIRQTDTGVYKAQCTKEYYATSPNKKSNIYLAAMVTAQARCRLHSQMLLLGPENIVYCDTDSIVWLRNPTVQLPSNMLGSGLGRWVDEHPNEKIKIFVAAAPKMYMLIYNEDEPSTNEIKAKGICLTLENKKKLTLDEFQKALYFYKSEQDLIQLKLYNMTIYPNTTDGKLPYAQMMTRYNMKKFGAVISKRTIQPDETWKQFDITIDNFENSDWENAFATIGRLRTKPLGFHA
jgi:hypothetical protein